MEGLRAQFGAKLGPLPLWAWALLAVLAVVGYMYITHSGFFAPASNTPGAQDTSGDQGLSNNDLPVGLGGLSGAGGASPNAAANPASGFYDPTTGAYAGLGSSSGNIGSSPTVDLSGGSTLGSQTGSAFANAAQYAGQGTIVPAASIPGYGRKGPAAQAPTLGGATIIG